MQTQGAVSSVAAASELLQPLLAAEDAAQQGSSLKEPSLQETVGFDPFPATTAARTAAAEVARIKAAAASRAGNPSDDLRAALLGRSASAAAAAVAGKSAAATRFQRQLSFAYGLSWVVNVLLLAAKLYAYYLSQSKAVLASAADSAVDLVSSCVCAGCVSWQSQCCDGSMSTHTQGALSVLSIVQRIRTAVFFSSHIVCGVLL